MAEANPYLQETIDATLQDVLRNYNQTTKPQIESAMVNSGSFGNSGLQQLQQNSQSDLQKNLGQTAGNMRYGDYWNNQNFERTLYNDAYGQNQQNLQTGINLIGLQNQYGQQDLNNANTVQNTPLNYWQQFANQANSIGQGYGTQSSSMSGGSGSPLTGALGGWQLGGALQNSWGGSNASSSNTGWGTGSQYGNQDYGSFI